MPTPDLILADLSGIAMDYWYVAVVWHLIIGSTLLAALLGWRPTKRVSASLLTVPFASVALFAFLSRSWFNATIFGFLTLVLALTAMRWSADSVRRSPTWAPVAGALMISYAWVYPHFLPRGLPLALLYAAPVGLLPCPTVALVIGFTLLFGAFGSRRWTLVLVGAGLFYGLFGALRLRVGLDLGLIAGALALALTLRVHPSAHPGSPFARVGAG